MASLFPLPILLILTSVPGLLAYGNSGDGPIRGVNLGGWLILEKWITPQVFQGLPDSVVDEYTFCKHLGKTEASRRLKAHWDSWVTENDIVRLKNAGINHLRIPIGYWAYEIPQGEPWVQGSADYAMRAVNWAKKYGLKVMIDLHGAPGSQNGNDHSGRSGTVGFFYNDNNLVTATRIIGRIAQIANSTEYRNTISIIQLLNEPILWQDYDYRLARLKQYYRMAYDEVRKYNNIAVVAVHDAFIGHENWYYLRDDSHYWWVMLDLHYYQVFTDEDRKLTCEQHWAKPCQIRNALQTSNNKLWTVVGEFSLATPSNCNRQDYFAKQQMGVFESATGWMFWGFKHGNGWTEWDFLASYQRGFINLQPSRITPTC